MVTCRLENKLGAGVSVVIHNALEFLHCHSVSSIGQRWQNNHEEVLDFETSHLNSFELVLEVALYTVSDWSSIL